MAPFQPGRPEAILLPLERASTLGDGEWGRRRGGVKGRFWVPVAMAWNARPTARSNRVGVWGGWDTRFLASNPLALEQHL